MISIDIAAGEVISGVISADHLATAAEAIKRDGIVVLNDIINADHIAIVRDRMLEDVDAILRRKNIPYNFTVGNIQQDPPPFAPYLFRDILVNEIVISVTSAILGKTVVNTYYSGNTCLPSKVRQPVHADTGQLWPNLPIATPAYVLVVNVPMVDMSAENGSTEIWPGTHLDTTIALGDDIKIPMDIVEKRREVCPPFQPSVRSGGVVIRDMRLWHAGMPNLTQTPRPMIAMIHCVSWWAQIGAIEFAREAEELLKHPVLRTNARFVDGPIDHTAKNVGYDFVK